MIITYQGKNAFRISQGDLVLTINPETKTSADITLFTNQKSPAYAEDSAGRVGFVIDGPGEYEVKGVFIKGFMDKTFLITFEGIKLCFLSPTVNQENEELEDIDILFVPIDAYKSAVALEPAVIIPVNYDKASLTQFLKEVGETDVLPMEKFVVKKKDLEGKEGEVVVLKAE